MFISVVNELMQNPQTIGKTGSDAQVLEQGCNQPKAINLKQLK